MVHHPVVASLPAGTFKAWVQLLCLAKDGDGVIPKVSEVAFHLRCGLNAAVKVTEELVNDYGLLEPGPAGTFRPKNWDKHQYKSDVSTERVRTFRKRKGNVSETVPETEYRVQSQKQSTEKEPGPIFTGPADAEEIRKRKLTDLIATQLAPTENPLTVEELDTAWEIHKKWEKDQSRVMAFQYVHNWNFEGKFDLARFRRNHLIFCEYWDRRDWTYCTLSFLNWVENGMPLPPPEPKSNRKKSKNEELLEEIRREIA